MGFVAAVDAVEGVADILAVDFGSEWHSVAAQLLRCQFNAHNQWDTTSIPKAARIDVMLGCWSAITFVLLAQKRAQLLFVLRRDVTDLSSRHEQVLTVMQRKTI
jgi:hypothetical protein